MKKIISPILICALLLCAVLSFTSCSVLGFVFGTYSAGTTTAEFGLGKVTVTEEVEILGVVVTKSYECKYKIEENDDGDRTIVFTYEGDADEHLVFSGERAFSEGEEDGQKYVKIGIIKYYSK